MEVRRPGNTRRSALQVRGQRPTRGSAHQPPQYTNGAPDVDYTLDPDTIYDDEALDADDLFTVEVTRDADGAATEVWVVPTGNGVGTASLVRCPGGSVRHWS